MKYSKIISEMFTRLTDTTVGLKALGRNIPNIELVNKPVQSLLRNWEPKVTAIFEATSLA